MTIHTPNAQTAGRMSETLEATDDLSRECAEAYNRGAHIGKLRCAIVRATAVAEVTALCLRQATTQDTQDALLARIALAADRLEALVANLDAVSESEAAR